MFQRSPPWFQSYESMLTRGISPAWADFLQTLILITSRIRFRNLPCIRQGSNYQLGVPSILHAVSSNNLRSKVGYQVASVLII